MINNNTIEQIEVKDLPVRIEEGNFENDKGETQSFVRLFVSVDVDGDSRIGDYGSDMIFNMVLDDSQSEVPVSKDNLYADIKRASLFSSAFNPTITLKAGDNGVYLVNDNVNCCLNSDSSDIDYELVFNVSELDTVVSHMDSSDMSMSPVVKEGEVLAVRFKSDNGFVALIGGIG